MPSAVKQSDMNLQRSGAAAADVENGLVAKFRSPEFKKKIKKKKNEMYRQSRMLHTYVSALAFILLLFFALSGLMLNHPEWFQSDRVKTDDVLTLREVDLKAASATGNPVQALSDLVSNQIYIPGELKNHEDLGDGYQLEYRGLGGSASVFVDLLTGEAEVTVRRATIADKMHNLHKGKYTGTVWPWIIDITAYLTLALSLFGFIILFTVKMRLKNSLRVIGGSTVFLGALIYFLVP